MACRFVLVIFGIPISRAARFFFEYKAFLMLNTVVNVNVITVNSNNVKGFHINNNVKELQITLVNVELKS